MLPEMADLPDGWLEVSWNACTEHDSGMAAVFCTWHCAYDFCGQMDHQQAIRLLQITGRPS